MSVFVPAAFNSHLLIATPHSSSTAALLSLANMSASIHYQYYPCNCGRDRETGVDKSCANRHGARFALNESFGMLTEHTDVCNIGHQVLHNWVTARTLYKQHVPPTRHNGDVLAACALPVVVLLRRPVDALRSDCERAWMERFRRGKIKPRGDLAWQHLVAGAAQKLRDFAAFDAGWRLLAAARPRQIALLTFEELASAGRAAVLPRALEHWGVAQVAPFVDYKGWSVVKSRYVNRSTPECARVVADAARTAADISPAAILGRGCDVAAVAAPFAAQPPPLRSRDPKKRRCARYREPDAPLARALGCLPER